MKTKNKACIRRDGVSFLSEPSLPNRCADTLDATNPQIVTDLRNSSGTCSLKKKGGFGVDSVSSVDEKRVKKSIDECEPLTAQLNFNSICLDSMLLEHRQSVNVNRTGNKNTKDESPFHANMTHEPSQHQVPDVPTFTGFPNVPVVLDFELGVIRSAASSSMPMNRPISAVNSESHKRKPAPNDVVREYYNTSGSHKRSRRQAYVGNRCPQIDPEFTKTRRTTVATGPLSEYKAFGPCKCVCLHCSAQFWEEEKLSTSSPTSGPLYHRCCLGGRVKVFIPREYHPFIHHLFSDKHFLENIRAYNQMFAMTSLGANIDE